MTTYDVLVDGFNLNTAFSGVDSFTGRRALPGRRQFASISPGQYGLTPIHGEFEVAPFAIGMWVIGDEFLDFEQNISTIQSKFVKPGLRVIDWVHPDGTTWRCNARIIAAADPEIDTHSKVARLIFPMENPKVFWRSVATSVSNYTQNDTWKSPVASSGSLGPIYDATITVSGPVGAFTLTTTSGALCHYSGTVPNGQSLVIDCGKMTAKLNGADVTHTLAYVGSGSRFLDLYPTEQVKIIAQNITNTGLAATVTWSIEAFKTFL